ncbi:MAG: type II toxin-antitoxin system death-on-curing family toxin [Phycisphaerae bacterium]|nr:type II toxin-antitoxin system death-on-curing family toxin [Phycisphaerae bacterium]
MTPLSIGRPRFVTQSEALAYHELSIQEYGGAHGVRDAGALDSAIAMPMQGLGDGYAHAFPFEMAAAYAFHIAKNHPFIDGNKRTALLCCGAFLRMNGWDLGSKGTEAADAILAVVENRMAKHDLAVWLQQHCRERPRIELRDFFAGLTYQKIHEFMASGLTDNDAERAHVGRVNTMLEAAAAIPAITQANRGGMLAQSKGEQKSADILFGQAHLLTALYRIAEDMGYEW